MNLVRRSISLPEDIYESLRVEAFSRRISVNELMVDKFRNKSTRFANDDLSYFAELNRRLGTNNRSGEESIRKLRDKRADDIVDNR